MIALLLGAALAGDAVLSESPVPDHVRSLMGLSELSATYDFDRVSIPGSLPFWVATGATVELCRGAAAESGQIRSLVEKGNSHLDYGEDAEAREAFRDAEAVLSCASEEVDSDLLWDLYFSSGILAATAEEAEEAARLFRAAALAKPSGTWNEMYNPDLKDLYLRGREAAATASQTTLSMTDPTKRILEAWLDGVVLDVSEPSIISADQHLLQLRFESGVISVQLQSDGEAPVRVVAREAVPHMLRDPSAHLEVLAVLLPEATAALGVSTLQIVYPEEKQIWRFDINGLAQRDFVWPEPARPAVVVSAPPEVVTTATMNRISFAMLGGMVVYPRDTVGRFMGGVSPLLAIHLVPEVAVDLGMQNAFGKDQEFTLYMPMFRTGVRYYPLQGDSRPYVGAAATLTLHEVHPVGLGGGALVGFQQRIWGPVHADLDLLVGYNAAVTASFAAGIGVGFP